MRGGHLPGAGLPQLLLALLRVTPGDHREAQLVQVASEEVAEAGVAARDVHMLVSFIGHSGELSDPAEDEEEEHEAQEVQEHVWR